MRKSGKYHVQDSHQVHGKIFGSNKCAPCCKQNKTTEAPLYCSTCKTYLCSDCRNVHETFDFMSGHEITSTGQRTSLFQGSSCDLSDIDVCKDHRKPFEFYCGGKHQTLCCSLCLFNDHRACSGLIPLQTSLQNVTSDGDVVKNSVKTFLQEVNDVIKRLEKRKGKVQSQAQSLHNDIERTSNALVARAKLLSDAASKQLTDIEQSLLKETDAELNVAKNQVKRLKDTETKLVTALSLGTDRQKAIAAQLAEKHMALWKDKEKPHSDFSEFDLKMNRNRLIDDLLRSAASPVGFMIDTVKVETPVIKTEETFQLTLFKSKDLNEMYENEKEPLYFGMTFLHDDRLVAIDNRNMRMKVLDKALIRVGQYTFEANRLNIATVASDSVVVTSGGVHVLEFFHISEKNKVTLLRKLDTSAQYNSVCLINEGTFLVSTFEYKCPLRMVKETGDRRQEADFPNIPEEEFGLEDTWSTFVPDKSTIAMSYRKENKVYLYEIKKNYATRRTVEDKRLIRPCDLCVGPEDSIFVCSSATNAVVQISLSGQVISSHELSVKCPFTICVSNDFKKLAVANNLQGECKLQVYDIERKGRAAKI